jgi:hypothetical protein
MKSASVKAFFSCSFKNTDMDVNDFFRAICEGLDIACHNVDGGYSELPPDKALSMIGDADVVIAIATARSKFDGTNQFCMPEAVSNEISFAYSLKKPLLVIKEENVRADGFLNSYGTHLPFDRTKLWTPDFLKKAIMSVHNVKLGALSDHELLLSQEVTEFIAQKVSHLYELEREGVGFYWQHSMQRTIDFTKNFNKPLKISRWNDFAVGKAADDLKQIELTFEIIKSSRNFDFTIEYEEHTAYGVTANVLFNPLPVAGDSIEYFVSYRGKHLCATYMEETNSIPEVDIEGRRYAAFDGIIPVNRAKDIEIQFRFAREYRLAEGDAQFFVASFAQGIDYVVQSEIERAHIQKEVVGGKLSITARITSPLMRHVYGVAWVPPSRPKAADESDKTTQI